MDPVSMLIFNALARRQGVNLPGIGTLFVVSLPAQMGHAGVLTPPSCRVEFTHDEVPDCPGIVDLIILTSRKDEEKSWEIYNKWYAEAYSEDQVTIDTVGVLRAGVFTPAKELNKILNPTGMTPRKVQKDMSMKQLAVFVALAVVVGVGLSWGVITWLDRSQEGYFTESIPAAVLTPATPVEELPAENEVGTVSGGDAAEVAPAAGTASTSASEVVPVPTSVPSPAPAPAPAKAAPSGNSSATASGPRFYVVVGTYSTEANANKFIASAQKRDAQLTYKKLTLSNGKIMIYTADSATKEGATTLRRAQSVSFPDAWIFQYTVR